MTEGTPSPTPEFVLPPRTRAFHIGPPKTATTSIQQAAASTRSQLLRHGVLYPGKDYNQRLAVAAYLGRGAGWRGDDDDWVQKPPPMRHWRSLMAEIEKEQERRIWFGHEYAASATDDVLRDWAAELGPRLHVLITLRAFSSMLPSMWQETLKGAARRASFDRWLRHAFDPARPANEKLLLRNDPAALARRWAAVIGAENVTVIVLDRKDQDFVYRSFEGLFGLPEGLLVNADRDLRGDNRSMSTAEIEMIRQLNLALRDLGIEWNEHSRFVYRGAAARMLEARKPGPGEAKLGLPQWAAKRAHSMEEGFVEGLQASGVRILGELSNLVGSGAHRTEAVENHADIDQVPIDAAVQALVGVIAAATGRRPGKFEVTRDSAVEKLVADVKDDATLLADLGRDSVRRLRKK